ncbi:MAG: leucine-rich repeat protein [Oscillospiraceae bacterium]|jgi:hypothetical protein|nr:leucine-rich repeat protein [Oscillospiraceae bacterium]
MKRLVALLMGALLCLAAGSLAEEEGFTLDGIAYEVRGGEAYVVNVLPEAEVVTVHARPGGYPLAAEQRLDHTLFAQTTAHTVIVAEGVTTLGGSWFVDCESIRRVELPSTLQMSEETLFSGCTGIESYTVAEGNPYIKAVDGVLFSADGSVLLRYPAGRAGAYQVPEGVQRMDFYAFMQCIALTEISFPDSFPDALGVQNFIGCDALRVLHLGAGVSSVDYNAMWYCPSLTRIEVDEANPFLFDIDGVLFSRAAPHRILAFPRSWGTYYAVPEQVTELADNTFQNNRLLQSITLPRGITEIPDGAFIGCTALRQINLPLTITSIGSSAFYNCIALEHIALPPALDVLGMSAFTGCTSLKSITIPEGITSISPETFAACTALEQVNLPDGLLFIDMYAFNGCTSLASLTLPDTLITIGTLAFNGYPGGITLLCGRETPGYWYAMSGGALWAGDDGQAQRLENPRSPRAVIVNLPAATDTLPLRAAPDKSARVLDRYQNGTTARLLYVYQGDWCRVMTPDGRTGFFPMDQVVELDDYNVFVLPEWAQAKDHSHFIAYTAPDESQPMIQRFGETHQMRVLYQVGSWYKLLYDTKPVYVPTRDMIVAVGEARRADDGFGYAVVTNDNLHDRLHLREEASKGSASLGRFFSGTQVSILGYVNEEWAHVRLLDGRTGYMMRAFLTEIYTEDALLAG